jgi:galactoside O-acetyltransferase
MSIAERVEIGDDVMLSWGVTVVDHNSHSLVARERATDVEQWLRGRKDWTGIKIAPVEIRQRAWLGFNVAVLPGVVIGEGAIVGACAVVTRSVPAWTIVAGNPARVLRELTAEERA